MRLRVLSYLAPSVPAELFDVLAAHLETAAGFDVDVGFDSSRSGPRPGEPEPFSGAEVDVAFLCATSYVWLTNAPARAVELLGAAWVPTDPRAAGTPTYFGDVLAPAGGPSCLPDLDGRRVAYNDDVSLSGYHSLRLALGQAGVELDDVTLVRSGSHLRSIDLLRDGEADAAAIDSNVWRRRRRQDPTLARAFHVVAQLGPHPVQPVVVRAGVPATVRDRIRDVLLTAHTDETVANALAHAELTRFTTVSDADYAGLRAQMAQLGLAGTLAR